MTAFDKTVRGIELVIARGRDFLNLTSYITGLSNIFIATRFRESHNISHPMSLGRVCSCTLSKHCSPRSGCPGSDSSEQGLARI
jgi:hypothetical protein